MTREEIIELIRNELSIDVNVSLESKYWDESSTFRTKVVLKLGEKVISESSDSVAIKEAQ